MLETSTRNLIGPVRPGYSTDPIDVNAGLAELKEIGYDDPHTAMVIEYALRRWARGEEEQAERGAIDKEFHGIPATCWRRVLAAAVAKGYEALNGKVGG